MLLQILQHTPTYVFAIFAALLWLGSKALVTRTASLKRMTVMAVAMGGLSLYGVFSAFPAQGWAIAAWAVGGLAVFAVMFARPVPAGTSYDAWQQRFTLPGSVVPLALMMGIFATKYAVGILLAMHPQLASQLDAALVIGVVYGAFSGSFAVRTARLWRLAQQAEREGLSLIVAA